MVSLVKDIRKALVDVKQEINWFGSESIVVVYHEEGRKIYAVNRTNPGTRSRSKHLNLGLFDS